MVTGNLSGVAGAAERRRGDTNVQGVAAVAAALFPNPAVYIDDFILHPVV